MWSLHVVVIQGQQGWQTGLVLWLTVALAGGGFAWLSGEWWRMDALLVDLALAAAGGALLNAATDRLGSDPLALIFDVRIFWTVLGAVIVLCLAHDVLRLYWTRRHRDHGVVPLGLVTHGGFLYLLLWLTGWPSEPGVLDATYDGGLPIKLLPDTLHYQARVGPFAVARAAPLVEGLVTELDDSTLTLAARAESKAAAAIARPIRFCCIRPRESAIAIKDEIARRQRTPEG